MSVSRGSHDHQRPQVPRAQIGPVTIIRVQKITPTSAPEIASHLEISPDAAERACLRAYERLRKVYLIVTGHRSQS